MKKKILLLLVLMLVLIFSLITFDDSISYKHLTPNEAAEIMQNDKTALILDVRTVAEYEKQHIPGAVLLPLEEIQKGNFGPLKDKDQKILIYCWTGRRAENVAAMLIDTGFTNVFEFGGIVDWKGALEGTDVEK